MLIQSLHVENYLSLRDVTIAFKPLTIIVGPNASGKTNVLSALGFVSKLMLIEKFINHEEIVEWFWAGDNKNEISLSVNAETETDQIFYSIILQSSGNKIKSEKLVINGKNVIDIVNGKGSICDEDGQNRIDYKSNKIALESAGAYGEKPVTKKFADFIKSFKFYNVEPEKMRDEIPLYFSHTNSLESHGTNLRNLLFYWHKNNKADFNAVNKLLEKSLNRKLEPDLDEEDMNVQEGYDKVIPLKKASDGTLRLLAYYALLHQEELPKLIAIEEPERNLHPAALTEVANLLQDLSERTQVVITTHSSRLLGALNAEDLGKDIEVVLLQNKQGEGTTVIDLNQARQDRPAFKGWMEDFGIGSAIFDSKLI